MIETIRELAMAKTKVASPGVSNPCCRDENPVLPFFGALWVSLSMCKPLKYIVYFFNYTLGYSGILRAYTANWHRTGIS